MISDSIAEIVVKHLDNCLCDKCVFARLPEHLRRQAEALARVRAISEEMSRIRTGAA